ncbi:hypothetical protein GH714_026713 [Hevea brasiliensis]|uniref:Uncharacterized protein n=1 Tax=Hevea brasiliensis TaxID=3981 RepID=A0A6A6KF91_HEVBR|nr:hypothetical protein GH714_026665 [Hevea brasiliensis]KAF2286743.1 hypothetical protein GH714_026687 [Hevea brasiliensis]KAF2286744.1 hypothetical protein GH714_026713 [Hevea brasiliensis]
MEETTIVVDRAAAKEMNRNLIGMNDPLNLQSSDHPGYPDWFKSKNKGQQSGFKQHKPNGASGNKVAAMVDSYDLDTPIEVPDANSRIDELSNMLGSIQQKLQIMVKGKNSVAATAVGHSGSTSYLGTSTL